ncbi:metalloregulator ArsR/SmtB family transcription factor [Nocardia brasiliensis]|uniref:Metalloregulator ArsR/SmtB family transcription factor n=1 Tax=Nocardia brasiliensis TaxID=37326 RepID=A0A6G9XWU6_NOCBR|nr:metalloregulator ArsR/SmtB family transcription factor [Nocardia brasiliensis]QIS05399.1 metalloregulator ArsR/SmtB family transcription factor [Nocardia brasiliensis]
MDRCTARIFEALGDPIRRYILELVATGEQPAGVIVAAVQDHARISQPGVSQHLKVLRDAGLVRVRAAGTRRFYTLDETGLLAAKAWLSTLADPLHQLAQPLDALATEIARGKRARRTARPHDGRELDGGERDARHA